MSTDRKTLALAYLDAVAKQQYDKVEALLAPNLHFKGPAMTRTSAQEFVGALKRLAAIHLRNDVKRVFADGDDVCVIYDFVTDTAAGALPAIEWLNFDGGRIRSINLYYDLDPGYPGPGGQSMFVRLGSFEVVPGKLDELRAVYNRDCAPIVKAAPGNLDVYLLEPAEGAGPIVACTIWATEGDAVAYDASGTAKEVVGKVRHFFAGPPTLRSYRIQR